MSSTVSGVDEGSAAEGVAGAGASLVVPPASGASAAGSAAGSSVDLSPPQPRRKATTTQQASEEPNGKLPGMDVLGTGLKNAKVVSIEVGRGRVHGVVAVRYRSS
jgi:hypothetical protein